MRKKVIFWVSKLLFIVLCFATKNFCNHIKLLFKSSRQNEQAHCFDKTNTFFFNVVVFGVCMENSVWILFRSKVVTQNHIKNFS